MARPHRPSSVVVRLVLLVVFIVLLVVQITGGITNVIFKARNAATGEGALVRVYGKDTDLLLDRRCGAACFPFHGFLSCRPCRTLPTI